MLIFFNAFGMANKAIKNPAGKGRVNISIVHLELLRRVHECKWIAVIVSRALKHSVCIVQSLEGARN